MPRSGNKLRGSEKMSVKSRNRSLVKGAYNTLNIGVRSDSIGDKNWDARGEDDVVLVGHMLAWVPKRNRREYMRGACRGK